MNWYHTNKISFKEIRPEWKLNRDQHDEEMRKAIEDTVIGR
jgi:hypothetical protein